MLGTTTRSAREPRAHELEACRTQLAEAVQREAYERAAELRDQIRALEALDAGSGSTS